MCGYCLDGPPDWVDVEMYINAGQVDDAATAAINLSLYYWQFACEKSKAELGSAYKAYGLNWRTRRL